MVHIYVKVFLLSLDQAHLIYVAFSFVVFLFCGKVLIFSVEVFQVGLEGEFLELQNVTMANSSIWTHQGSDVPINQTLIWYKVTGSAYTSVSILPISFVLLPIEFEAIYFVTSQITLNIKIL